MVNRKEVTENVFKRWETMGRADPVVFVNKLLGVPTHPGQEKYLRDAIRRKHFILSPSNQWGKSVIVACLHIWANYYKFKLPGWELGRGPILNRIALREQLDTVPYQTINLSPKLKQATLVYQYVLDILQSRFSWQDWQKANQYYSIRKWKTNVCLLKDFLVEPKRVPAATGISSVPIVFKNNSRLWIASTGMDKGASTAGNQYALMTYDECALSNYLEDELSNYLWSRLVKYDGSLHLISTPDADSDSYEYYRTLVEKAQRTQEAGDSTWGFQIGTIFENIFLNQESLARQEKEMAEHDPVMHAQVFRGEFVGAKSRFFTMQEVERVFREGVDFLAPQRGHRYVIGADFAVAQNFTVYICLDVTQEDCWYLAKMIRFKGHMKSPPMQLAELSDMALEYNRAEIVYDASSLAGPFIEYSEALDRLDTYPNRFDQYAKRQLLVALKKALAYNGVGRIAAPKATAQNGMLALKQELHAYREKDKGKVKDTVMALGLCAWRMEESLRGGDVQLLDLDPLALGL